MASFDPEAYLDGGVTRGHLVGLSKGKLFELAKFLELEVAPQIGKPDLVYVVARQVCAETRKEVEAEKRKAEEEHKRAQIKAEADQRKAEEDRRRAQRKAEEDQRREEDIQRAERAAKRSEEECQERRVGNSSAGDKTTGARRGQGASLSAD